MFATRRKHHKEEGQGLVEYALVIVLVAVVVVAGLTLFGVTVNSVYTTIAGLP
jgi:pilus assembly protein Flp/PilA